MKLPYFGRVLAVATALFLASGDSISAQSRKMTTAQMEAMCRSMGGKECRLMMRAMLKRKELHKAIKEAIKADASFKNNYGTNTSERDRPAGSRPAAPNQRPRVPAPRSTS